jgi:ATP-dependent DNA ligase
VQVALARADHTVPGPDARRWCYEPKFDGWRAVLFCARHTLHARSGADLSRRFLGILCDGVDLAGLVLDGELVALNAAGRLEFAALQRGSAARAQAGIDVYYMVFDVLAAGDLDMRAQPYRRRRARLEQLLAAPAGHIQVCPMTTDRAAALEWMTTECAAVGIEGVVSKDAAGRYRGGVRDWIKTRTILAAEAVILGVTGHLDQPHSLILGQPNRHGALRPVGVSLPLSGQIRAALTDRLTPLGDTYQELPGVVGGLPGHPVLRYLPVHPTVTVEVDTDAAVEFGRFRHRPRVRHVRELGQEPARAGNSRCAGRRRDSTSHEEHYQSLWNKALEEPEADGDPWADPPF